MSVDLHVYRNWHFFDVGIVNELAHRGTLKPGSLEFGDRS